jgi:hypothetical protein
MSSNQIKQLAKQFIEEEKQVLERHGDRIVRSKYKEAVNGARKTFEAISSASAKLKAATDSK